MMFNNLTIKSRLVIIIGVLSVLLVIIGGLGLYGINQSNNGLKSVYEDRTVTSLQLASILDIWYRVRNNALNAVLMNNVDNAKAKNDESMEIIKEAEGIWAKYTTNLLTPEEARLAEIKSNRHKAYVDTSVLTFQLASVGDFEAAFNNSVNDAGPKFAELRETVFDLLALQGSIAAEEYAAAQRQFDNIFMLISIIIGLGVVLAIIIGNLLIRSYWRPNK